MSSRAAPENSAGSAQRPTAISADRKRRTSAGHQDVKSAAVGEDLADEAGDGALVSDVAGMAVPSAPGAGGQPGGGAGAAATCPARDGAGCAAAGPAVGWS